LTRKSSDGQIETATGKTFIWKNNFYIVFLSFSIFLSLLLSLFCSKKFEFIILQFLLESFKFYFILKYGLFIIINLLSHWFDLLLLLFKSLLVGGNHAFLFHWWLAFQDLLKRLQLLFFLFQILLSFSYFLRFDD
jgi:hypothetical protein